MDSIHSRVGNAVVFLALAAGTARAQASFTPLGTIPPGGGGANGSQAFGVSASGTVAFGLSEVLPFGREAFRWTAAGGMSGIGQLGPMQFSSFVSAASADGTVLVGSGTSPVAPPNWEAFRWTAATGVQGLGFLPTLEQYSLARGTSADGSVVVGRSGQKNGKGVPYRWTSAGGMVALPLGAQAVFGDASGISADGSVIVGHVESPTGLTTAAMWVAGAGPQWITETPGSTLSSRAEGVSADGLVVFGAIQTPPSGAGELEAFRWSAAGGLQRLGFLDSSQSPWHPSSGALAANADGSVVVGRATVYPAGEAAFLWTETHGMVSIQEMLEDLQVPGLAGWELREARGVSADRTAIVGNAWSQLLGETQAWRVELPPPSPSYCTPKVNSLGCSPRITSFGTASASQPHGFLVSVWHIRNDAPGIFLYKVNGDRVAIPFQGGTLCIGPSGIRRSPKTPISGNPGPTKDCSGSRVLDFNEFAAGKTPGNPDPALRTPGNHYQVQAWGRDQGFPAPHNTTLSDAMDVTIGS